GELARQPVLYAGPGLSHVKWGLSRLGDAPDWRQRLATATAELERTHLSCKAVAVAYADCRSCAAPPGAPVAGFACQRPGGVLLVDTFDKTPRGASGRPAHLLNWLSLREVVALCRSCRDAGVRVALAGSLRAAQIEVLRVAEPDWFAVRGAVCEDGDRRAAVSDRKVRALIDFLAGPGREGTSGDLQRGPPIAGPACFWAAGKKSPHNPRPAPPSHPASARQA